MFFGSAYPDPIALQVGAFGIRWYSIFIFVGVAVGVVVARSLFQKKHIPLQALWDFVALGMVFSIVLGRAVFVLSYLKLFEGFTDTLKIWEGGISSHGVLLGGVLAAWVVVRRHHITFWTLTDVLIPGAAVAQAIGRWGNYVNQEVFGTPSTAWWAVPIDMTHRPAEFLSVTYFHPIWLYESLAGLLLFFGTYWLVRKRIVRAGTVTLWYLSTYYLIRYVLDFFRNDALSLGILTGTQVIAVGVWIIAITLVIMKKTASRAG